MFKTKERIDSQNDTIIKVSKIKKTNRQINKIELRHATIKISSRKTLSFKYNDPIPEVVLWQMVLLQAMEDCTSRSKKRECISNRFKAKAWIFFDNPDFFQVCGNANVNPVKFRNITMLRDGKL